VKDTLVGILKDHHWWPHFEQDLAEARTIIAEVRDSVEEGDTGLFDGSDKVVLSHTHSESRGTLSFEHSVWVVRILNPSIHLLQLACEVFVAQVVDHATRNRKEIAFVAPIQIVERRRKETIIEGTTLGTRQDRKTYARSHRKIEFWIGVCGTGALMFLILLTFPWQWRDLHNAQQTWLFFSVREVYRVSGSDNFDLVCAVSLISSKLA